MKISKNLLICALLMLVMLCVVSTASAEDTINENLTVSDAQEVILEEDSSQNDLGVLDSEDKLSSEIEVSDYDELKTAVSNAADGDTIILKDGTYAFPDEKGTIALSGSTGEGNYAKSLTFKGQSKNGVTITSPGNYAIFTAVDNYNLKVENINFNAITVTGTAVVFSNGNGNLDIINCAFNDCKTGWGIVRTGTSFAGQCTMNGVTFTNCEHTQNKAAGVALLLAGGATFNIENVVIDSAKITVTTNMAQSKGVIYILSSSATVNMNDVTIKNSDNIKTSLVYCSGTVNIKNSFFTNNNVAGTKLFHNNAGDLTIEQTMISCNSLTGTSNLIYNAGSSTAAANLVLNYNNIADNDATNIYGVSSGQNSVSADYNYWGVNYDDANALKTATNIDQTTWANKVGDTFVDQNGNPLAKEIPTESSTPEAGDIYVSSAGDDAKDGSTPDNAVQSIKHAIELANNGGNIIVIAGNYTVNEVLAISKDLTIMCESGVATIKGTSTSIFDNAASLTLENLKFESTSNNNGAIVNNNAGTLTIDKCIFEVNGAEASAIFADGGNVNIENSVLLNPAGYALTASSAATVSANNNWWGKNDSTNANVTISSWIVMDAGIDLARINPGDEVTITITFTKTNDGSDYEGALPEFNVKVTADNLNENLTVKNNQVSVKYTVNADDEATVISGSESIIIPLALYDAPEIIYVNATGGLDTNDGDEAHPVQSIAKAIELAVKGKIIILEGTYTIDNTLTINSDLDITGEGTVIVDGNSKRILNNNANLNITNIRFTNGFDNGGVIYNNVNLTLRNVEIYSNVINNRANAAVINNKKKLVVIDSKFYQNRASYGNIYNDAGEVLIDNAEFYNNNLTDDDNTLYGIGIYSRNGNAVIENTKFYENEGEFSVIYFEGKDSLDATSINTLYINNCTFEENNLERYGVIFSKANTTIKDSTFKNNHANKNDMYNGDGGAIYVNGQKVTVENSVFINNKALGKGNDIYVSSGELDISDSVLINTNGNSIEKVDSAIVSANDNWWGANTPNVSFDVERWVIMTVSANDTEIETDDVITITASFDKTNSSDGVISDYSGDLPEVFDVTFTSTSGNLNEVKAVKDKKAEVTYTVVEADKKITVSSDDAQETLSIHRILDTIYVSEQGDNDNDGDFNAPVKTLEKAVELAVKGKIIILNGTYKTGDLGIISQDLNITGEGKVIIDAQNSNRILYVGQEANVVLKNLIMINGFAADESGALLGNSNNLTLINCTLANSTAGENNGGAIYNVGHLTIINSTIANNTARVGGAIFSGAGLAKSPTITIENSVIENNIASGNDANGGGAIFAQQITAIDVKNTTFENNQAQTTASGGAIFVSLSEANINIENSRFIKNHANSKEGYGGGAIYMAGTSNYERKGSLTISNTLFEENTADTNGGAVYVRATTLKISSSVLINNTDENGYAIYGYGTEQINPSVNVNANWWGSNDNPKSSIGGYRFTPSVSTWAVLTVSNSSEIKVGEIVTLTATINTLNDGSTLANPINIETPITITTNLGPINGVLTDGVFNYDYTVPEGLKFISASVDDEDQILFVITTPTNVEINNVTANKGDRVEYTIKVTSSDGTIINKGNVELYFGDDLIETIPVINGEAKDTIIIGKDVGNHTITAKYIDESEEYGASEGNASLNVTGNNNIITPENFNNFFDENNVLREGIPFDELTFKGEFNNLGLITIDHPIKLTGDGAQFNNVSFKLDADDIELSNVNIVLDKLGEVDGAAIYIGGDNVVVSNSNITYNAPAGVQSYAIEIDYTDNVKIINNNIKYNATSEGDVKTYAVNAMYADNLVFENNVIDASIPSTSIGYSAYPRIDYYSQGVHVENSKNVSFNKNNITVSYNDVKGADDTIYAVHFDGCDDSRITNNDIELNGHKFAYGLVTNNCNNLTISGNDIKSSSDDHYAAGLQVGGKSSTVVDNNNISAKSNDVAYSVYLDDWGENGEVNLTNNNINGESDTVYGVYVEENKTLISGNTIDVNGNHVYGIVSPQTDVVLDGNEINATGKDMGDILSPQSGVDYNTTGIIVSEGSAEIKNNTVVTNGNSTIIAKNTNASITNNGLSANGTTADDSIANVNSDIKTSGNTEAKKKSDDKPVEPVAPVVKITATNNAKVFYSYGYTVRVTEDGKSVGAGKQVTLKIAGKTLTAKTNANGYATFKLAVKPKAYTVTAAYNGVTQNFKVTVKNVIKAKNLKVKKSAKKLKVKVTLKAGKNAIKGKKVVLKIKGKKIKAKTNKKGVATFKVKKNILKKLKAGKKYKYTVTYGKDTVKKTLKVKK